MPKTKQLTFSHQEVAAALVREQGIHEGFWGVIVEFGIGAANIARPGTEELLPAAIVPLVGIGIQRFDEENALTVDAAKVNPARQPRRKKSVRRKQKKTLRAP